MGGRIAYGLFPGVPILLAVGAALGQGMQTFTNEQAARRHCPVAPSCGSTHQARIITLRATLGTVARSAVVMLAKLRPTKTAWAHGQVQNERFWRMALVDLS